MKSIKLIIVILILCLISFIIIKGCSYVDFKVREKYETQLEGITKSPEELEVAKVKSIEIEKSKKRAAIESVVSLFVILLLLFVYFKLKDKS